MAIPVTSDKVFKLLEEAGLFSPEDRTTRVVIDLQVGHVAKMYVERFVDKRILDVLPTALQGVRIVAVDELSSGEVPAPEADED